MLENRFYWLFDENDGSNQGGGGDSSDSSKNESQNNEGDEESGDDDSSYGSNEGNEGEENESNESNEDEPETLELSNEQISLVRLLLDRNTRKATIKALAQREGLNLAESSHDDSRNTSNKDESKTAKNLVEEIQEIMGDDFDQLPKKFWKALERVVDAKISPVTSQIERNAMLQSRREVNEATNLLFKNFQDARKYSQDITQLTERYTPSEDQNAYEFLEEMYLLAKSKRQKSANSTDRKFEIRVKRNSKDAIQNASGRGNQNNNFNQNQNSGNKRRSIDDAINMAFARRK